MLLLLDFGDARTGEFWFGDGYGALVWCYWYGVMCMVYMCELWLARDCRATIAIATCCSAA